MANLSIQNLSSNLGDKKILKNINISIEGGKISFLLGRNGAGKSTLAHTLMGSKIYDVKGEVILDNQDISDLSPEDRARKGLFVSFQHPPEIEGVSMMSFLHSIYTEKFGNDDDLARSTFKFRKHLLSLLERVHLNPEFLDRSLNVGFSGGEKKRSEILQMLLLKPSLVILDEVDSGLDVHAMDILQSAVRESVKIGCGVLYISHNVDFVKKYPESKIFVIKNGEITDSGYSEVVDNFVNEK